jgi:hypothetical protein
MTTHYQELEIAHTATPDQIQRAYRTLARRFHPDRNPEPSALARMTRINAAYQCLIDPADRRQYDARFVIAEPGPLREAILEAARDTLTRTGWALDSHGPAGTVYAVDGRRLSVSYVDVLGVVECHRWVSACRRFTAAPDVAAVCLACRVLDEVELDESRLFAALDLVSSRWVGPPVPEPFHRVLCEAFRVAG